MEIFHPKFSSPPRNFLNMIEQEQNLIKVKDIAPEYHGPREFSRVIDVGNTFEFMRNHQIPVEARMKESRLDFEVVGFDHPEIIEAMDSITKIVKEKTDRNATARFEYQRELAKVFHYLNDGLEATFISILRAGDLVAQFYPQVKEVYQIEAKRLPMENGELKLGLLGNLPVEEFQDERLLIGEGCVATGLTIAGILKKVAEKDVKPELIRVDAAAVSQLGGEYLLKLANQLGIPFRIRCGSLVYAMDEKFYLRRTPEEGYPDCCYVVGDCGDFSEPLLFPFYRDIGAWWDQGRESP